MIGFCDLLMYALVSKIPSVKAINHLVNNFFFFSYTLDTITVVIGFNYNDRYDSRNANFVVNSVVSVKTPKSWTGKENRINGNDIAILKLKKKVKFILNSEKDAIMPACLPNRRVHNNVYNQKAYTAGNR